MKFVAILLLLTMNLAATRQQIQIQPTGPLQIAPARAALDDSVASRDRYMYAEPAPLYYCGNGCFAGYGCGFYGSYGCGFNYFSGGFIRGVPVITDYPR